MTEESIWSLVDPDLLRAVKERGFESLTGVQEAVLAPALAGRDLRISSQTGSGKTVAIGFALRPVVAAAEGNIAALVIVPTRELAKQVEQELSWLYAPLGARVASVTGGSSIRDERRALAAGPSIVVGTPGRLLDHLQRGGVDASVVAAVVLDEADRMLDLGFRDDIEAVFAFVPDGRRTHLVSATFPREVRSLADRVQTNPAMVEGTPLGSANEDIEHMLHLVAPKERFDAIVNLLLSTPDAQTLVFAKTRADVASLADALRDTGFVIGMLSGEMEQPERERALAAFKRGQFDAMVATDVAARGIDVLDIARVIHSDPPEDVDAYTHRSGRTGRAGRKGTSSVIVTPATFGKVRRLLERARVAFRIEPIPAPDGIRALHDNRVLEALAREPEGDDAPGEHIVALAERVALLPNVVQAIARLLVRARAGGPAEPRVLSPMHVTEPSRSKSLGADHARGEERSRQGVAARHDKFGRRSELPPPPRARIDPAERSWTPFRVAWGQAHGADARRLLAMVCRRGGLTSGDIGAIRVMRTYSIVEVASEIAEPFEKATRDPDPRDPRATIRRAPTTPEPGERPASFNNRADTPTPARPQRAGIEASSAPHRDARRGPRPASPHVPSGRSAAPSAPRPKPTKPGERPPKRAPHPAKTTRR